MNENSSAYRYGNAAHSWHLRSDFNHYAVFSNINQSLGASEVEMQMHWLG
jgi:hypothetical protein